MTTHIWRWLFAACLFTLILWLAGCSSASYVKTFPDGTTLEASAFEFATDKDLAGLEYESADVKISLESMDSNQTKAISLLAEGVAKGVVKGIKP